MNRPAFRSALAIALLLGLWLAMLLLGGPGDAADRRALGLFHFPALVPAALLVTRLGNAYVLLPLCAVAAATLAWAGRRRAALLFVVLILSGRLLVEIEKRLVARPRPDPSGRLDSVASMSFPSAHAANSTIAWLGLALLAADPRLRPAAVAAALVLAVLVGLTRLVLAVHWPSDVIAGWAFGAAWTLLFLRIADGAPGVRQR
jgi:undecaprenyl-diphosphatase